MEDKIKKNILNSVNRISAKSAMAMNRRERRLLGKQNDGARIPGSTKPYVKTETKNKKGVLNVE